LTHLSSIWQNNSKTRLKCINWLTWAVSVRYCKGESIYTFKYCSWNYSVRYCSGESIYTFKSCLGIILSDTSQVSQFIHLSIILDFIWQNKSKTRLKCMNWLTWAVSDRISPRQDLNVWIDSSVWPFWVDTHVDLPFKKDRWAIHTFDICLGLILLG
jgi:predicted Rdx family selenoprotein